MRWTRRRVLRVAADIALRLAFVVAFELCVDAWRGRPFLEGDLGAFCFNSFLATVIAFLVYPPPDDCCPFS